MKNLVILLTVAVLVCSFSAAALKELDTAAHFQQVISGAKSDLPVMVLFSAYWCGPCQRLKATVRDEVAGNYTDDQILICYVDAYVNSSLKQYLMGGYPTARVFRNGQVQSEYFVGSKSAGYVNDFVSSLIGQKRQAKRQSAQLEVIESEQDFQELMAKGGTVVISFSAYWCGPCQRLKATLKEVAPEFNQEEVRVCYVDAYVNTSLKKYLLGGYPTVRVFRNGQLQNESFVGSKSASQVRDFIKEVISPMSSFEPVK